MPTWYKSASGNIAFYLDVDEGAASIERFVSPGGLIDFNCEVEFIGIKQAKRARFLTLEAAKAWCEETLKESR